MNPIPDETVSSLDDVTTMLTSHPLEGAPAARSLTVIVTACVDDGSRFTEVVDSAVSNQIVALLLPSSKSSDTKKVSEADPKFVTSKV